MANKTQLSELKQFAQLLKDNGFTVIVRKKHYEAGGFEWMHFFKNGSFGYVDADYFGGYNFSTVHKPCIECGTGFSIVRETNELSIRNANEALEFAPGWAAMSDIQAIRKYNTVDEFINAKNNQWAEYCVL